MSRITSSSGKSWMTNAMSPTSARNSAGRRAKALRASASNSSSEGASRSVQSMPFDRMATPHLQSVRLLGMQGTGATMKKLTAEEHSAALKELPLWREVPGRDVIARKFEFRDFNEAFG